VLTWDKERWKDARWLESGIDHLLVKKGDKMKCENYWEIMLLYVAYKILDSIKLEWLEGTERVPMQFQTTENNSSPNVCSKAKY
jgi:hypothetical protein